MLMRRAQAPEVDSPLGAEMVTAPAERVRVTATTVLLDVVDETLSDVDWRLDEGNSPLAEEA